VADDPVVVKKSRPEKAGNRLEEKTETTSGNNGRGKVREFWWLAAVQKIAVRREGVKFYIGAGESTDSNT
jgi:hypothetical protein